MIQQMRQNLTLAKSGLKYQEIFFTFEIIAKGKFTNKKYNNLQRNEQGKYAKIQMIICTNTRSVGNFYLLPFL